MRLVERNRWVLVVAAATLLAGSRMFTATEPAPAWFFAAFIASFCAAATVDHRRHLRNIRDGVAREYPRLHP